jgi:hypothetical protein
MAARNDKIIATNNNSSVVTTVATNIERLQRQDENKNNEQK